MTRRNLESYRGDTFSFLVTVSSNGVPIDVTGYSFRMTAKYRAQDADNIAVFSLVSPTNITITDAANGNILVTIPPSATTSLQARVYRLVYDIQATLDANTIYTVCSGILIINPDISQTSP